MEASRDAETLRERDTALRNLDRLVIHHLLFDRKMGHVVLDPHLEEVLIVERAKKLVQEELELKFEPYLEQGNISSLTLTQLQRIRRWIDSTEIQKQPSEFTLGGEASWPKASQMLSVREIRSESISTTQSISYLPRSTLAESPFSISSVSLEKTLNGRIL